MEKIISKNTHAVLDYLMAIALLSAPWMYNFQEDGIATGVAVCCGALIALLSLCTKYAGGVIKLVPLRWHLVTDVFAGVFIGISPWLLGFSEVHYATHLTTGIFIIAVSLSTSEERRTTET